VRVTELAICSGVAVTGATSAMSHTFPFTAIVGQDEMKRALMIAAVDRSVGGVLVFGDRGTGKSTAVRAMSALLPPMEVIAGCRFNCDPSADKSQCTPVCLARQSGKRCKVETVPVPVIDMPLGATEDRVIGALDIERALTKGEKAFEPGLLARANRGFLYIDEVNLLEDHLVDVLLDVAASGENVVEREGLSVRHAARFVLVGSGNPEEGELRPQLLDRFGLSVNVTTPTDLATRIEVVRRRDKYERDPAGFLAHFAQSETAERERILVAQQRLPDIETPDPIRELAAKLALAVGADGLRGEITLLRTARALASLEGARSVEPQHIRLLAPSALRHRLRRGPLDDGDANDRVMRAIAEVIPV